MQALPYMIHKHGVCVDLVVPAQHGGESGSRVEGGLSAGFLESLLWGMAFLCKEEQPIITLIQNSYFIVTKEK